MGGGCWFWLWELGCLCVCWFFLVFGVYLGFLERCSFWCLCLVGSGMWGLWCGSGGGEGRFVFFFGYLVV